MPRHSFTLLLTLILVIFNISLAQSQSDVEDCSEVLPPHLIVGQPAQVAPENASRIRTFPSLEDFILGQSEGGETVVVINGPVCNDNFQWWFVDYEGLMGWSAEGDDDGYWLELPSDLELDSSPTVLTPVTSTYVEFDKFSITLTTDIASQVVTEIVPDVLEGPIWVLAPAHYQLTFEDYPAEEEVYIAPQQIHIYPTDGYEQVTGLSLDELRETLSNPDEKIPFGVGVPPAGARLVFTTEPTIINFQGGSAVRYIAHYSQAYVPIVDGEIQYVFTGLSDDGKWFILSKLSLASTLTPSRAFYLDETRFNRDALYAAYETYIPAIKLMLDNAPSSAFTPSLDALDTMFSSLSIGESP